MDARDVVQRALDRLLATLPADAVEGALAAALRSLLQDEGLRVKLGTAGRQRVQRVAACRACHGR